MIVRASIRGPRPKWRYWRPRRITGSWHTRHVYRWLFFFIAPHGWPQD